MKKIDGRYLKYLREKNGYSLRQFAELIYTSKSSLQRWENSSLPENEELLKRIAEVCNVSIDELKNNTTNAQEIVSYEEAQCKFQAIAGLTWLPFIAGLFIIFITVALFI